jgi:hypothetical protein
VRSVEEAAGKRTHIDLFDWLTISFSSDGQCGGKGMSKSFQISRRSFLNRCALTAAATGLPLWFVERELALAAEPVAKTR